MIIYILILIIIWLVILIVAFFNWVFARRNPQATIQLYTGSLGQGKTKIGVGQANRFIKRKRLLWALSFLKNNEIPILYSNIPIVFKNGLIVRLLSRFKGYKLDKYENNKLLEYEHLVMIKPVIEYSVIFIDELSDICDQYSFDNPFVVQYIQKFIRYYRHFIDGSIIMTDQVTDNVTKPIRTRIGLVYNLINFRRFLFHWYKVDVLDVMLTEDIQTISSSQLESPPYMFGHLPFKYLKFLDWTRFFTYKQYESRCFKPLYEFAKIKAEELDINGGLFTTYVIELPDNSDMKKQYKKDGYISIEDMKKYIDLWKKRNEVTTTT